MPRRLTTIVAADIAGYSRLIGQDEEGTLAAMRALRADVIDPLLAQHGGRVANTAGDSLLIEFPSAVEAVRCAIAVQAAAASRAEDLPEDRRILFRVGVNVGDVVAEGDDLLGDGVNVAARLEALAPPGGIVISRSARDQVRDRLDLNLSDLGEVEVKNIARPVRAFQVLKDGEVAISAPKRDRRPYYIAAAAIVLICAAVFGWWSQRPDVEPLNMARLKYDLPDRPSIAVTPFASLDAGGERNVLADGLTIEIITALSRSSNLMVIASESMRAFTDENKSATEVAEELGVRYVLEGGLQQIGEQLKVNVRLIDVLSGQILWADTHEGETVNFFNIQEAISTRVSGVVGSDYGIVADAEVRRARKTDLAELNAYQLSLLAADARADFTKEGNLKAFDLLAKALESDPDNLDAHVGLAASHNSDVLNGWTEDIETSVNSAYASAKRAVQIDPNSAKAQVVLGVIQTWMLGQPEEGVAALELAKKLEPNSPDILLIYGATLADRGRAAEGADIAMSALRVNPRHPNWYYVTILWPLVAAGRHQEATEMFSHIANPSRDPRTLVLISLVSLERIQEAREVAAAILEEDPEFSVSAEAAKPQWSAPRLAELVELAKSSWLAAGLPE